MPKINAQRTKDLQAARCRHWGYFLGAYITGPIWPAIIANRSGQWKPFWVGLFLGIITLPFYKNDWGVISALPAATVSTVMMAGISQEKRRLIGASSGKQADAMYFSESF